MTQQCTARHRAVSRFRPAAAAGLAALMACLAAPGTAVAFDCATATEEAIAEAGIAAEDVKAIVYTSRAANTDVGTLVWVELRDNPDRLVIDLTPICSVRQTYWQPRKVP
jgi:hypothetical protein